MSKFKMLMLAGVATLGLLSMQAAPAGATTAAAGVFVGTAVVSPGLYYPVDPTNPGCNNPLTVLNVPVANVACPTPSAAGTWNFFGTGVGSGGGTNAPAASGTTFNTNASGRLANGIVLGGAWCGASGGANGSGRVEFTGPPPSGGDLYDLHWDQSAATVIAYQGKIDWDPPNLDADGDVVGVLTAVPTNIPAASCLAGTAKDFTVVGAAVAYTP